MRDWPSVFYRFSSPRARPKSRLSLSETLEDSRGRCPGDRTRARVDFRGDDAFSIRLHPTGTIRRIDCPITVSFDTASEISIPSCSAGYALSEDLQRKRKAFAFSFYRHRATGFRTVECQREDCLNVQLECTQPAGRRTQSLRY